MYSIFDPTGNITALVETAVDVADQPAVAARIMELEPDVEQVGFITYTDKSGLSEGEAPVSLRMAGGEFCGNATMCAAALFAIRNGLQGSAAVRVRVSGAKEPLEVQLSRKEAVSFEQQAAASFSAAVSMPPALSIDELKLAAGRQDAGGLRMEGADSLGAMLTLPIVQMEGISHIIVEPDSGFIGLKDDPALAETLLRQWCGALGADCLGMMFLGDAGAVNNEGSAELRPMIPLVYVPGADTMFWENSCASGSAAAGIYLAAKAGKAVDVTFDEPAGQLRVESDPATGKTTLHGCVKLAKECL